jgi:chemotaxis protein CheD
MQYVIGIGEYAISDNTDDTLKTYALSTCVALTVYSPLKKILGMVHIALPYSSIDKTGLSPGYYAETAVPLMLERMYLDYGCKKNELVFILYGGARSISIKDTFNIGNRNVDMIQKILETQNIICNTEETGGLKSRTIEVDVLTGQAIIQYNSIII